MTLILSLPILTSGHGISHVVRTASSFLIGQLKPELKFKAASTQSLIDAVKMLEKLLDKEKA